MLGRLRGIFGAPSSEEDQDLFPFETRSFYQDPYPYYRRLRSEQPIYLSPSGAWVLSRYADNVEALSHPDLGNTPSRFSTLHESKSDRFVCADLARNIMPFLDGPVQQGQRKLIGKIFQREVKAIGGELREIAEKHVSALAPSIEVMRDLGTPFALEVICRVLGIPVEAKLQTWSNHFFYLFTQIPSVEVRNEVDQSLREFRQWLGEQMSGAGAGALGQLKEAVDAGDLEEAVAIDSMILFFADGLENVDSGIGNLLYLFSNHPEQWKILREEERMLGRAVDECLRYESPAQYVARTCLRDFEWKGERFKKDRSVILLLGSANRDEQEFESGERFDVTRTPNRHIAFGKGGHSCLGGNLVEREFAAILAALRNRFREIRQAGPIEWQERKGHRWMKAGNFEVR